MACTKKQVIIIGAGAAGLMCAIEAAKRGRDILVLDHANKVGKKILMSGGGRCNFTNYNASPVQFESSNPHFFKSALSRYTQWDFITLVDSYQLAYHEKTLGQLFCDNKSKEIVNILLSECEKYDAKIQINTKILKYRKTDTETFHLQTSEGDYECDSLVIATGGLSIPTMGATGFGYQLAKNFGLKVLPTRAGLVPFCLSEQDKERYASLSGISAEAILSVNQKSFRENMLFTHRGLSGPAILQISSYWHANDIVEIDLLPEVDLLTKLEQLKMSQPKIKLKTALERFFAKRIIPVFIDERKLDLSLANAPTSLLKEIHATFKSWRIKPVATEGYRTAEVTIGGVDPNEISSKTFETHKVKNLYFIGEVIDVAGWLGGYNFQWAWSSGWAAGQVV